jgi:hypothetical protein
MNATTRSGRALVLMAALLALVLSACGNSTKKSTSPATAPGQAAAVTAGINTCTTCHTLTTADWLTSRHANTTGVGLNDPGSPTLSQVQADASCGPCHDPNGDSAGLRAGYTGDMARPVVGCEACHGPGSVHVANGGQAPIVLTANTAAYSIPVSNQFALCTSCHGLISSDGTTTIPTTHDAASSVAPSGSRYTITDTHFAVAKNGGTIVGYAMDFFSPTVCTNCHDPHKDSTDIGRQWAQSSFADKTASLWNRNWSQNNNACFRCHTTTGFAAFSNALSAGNTTLAQQILYGTLSTSLIPSAPTWKAEMLLCTGCHTDNKGGLRNPGAYTASYVNNIYGAAGAAVTITSLASYAYPDIGNSNQCMPCHTGRLSGDSIKNMNTGAVTAVDFSNVSALGNHNYQAGGVMFRGVGYNYPGRDYSNPARFMHDKIGTPNSSPASGTNGPCIRCHMTNPNGDSSHLFPRLSSTTSTTFTNGTLRTVITNIPYGLCSTCHGTNPVAFLDMVNQEKNNFFDAQNALAKAMEAAGLYYRRSGTTSNAGSFYRARDTQTISAGTMTIANLGVDVNGSNTNWVGAGVQAGDRFRVDSDGTWYDIASVDTPTHITLATAFTGTNYLSNTNYTIRKNETVSVAAGAATVTGTGTRWLSSSETTTGDKFRIDSNGVWYTIASVASDTQLTLSANYAGPSATTTEFTLRTSATATLLSTSTTVTISGANLIALDVYANNDYFRIDSEPTGTWVQITARTANTLTLRYAYPYTGPAGTALPFTIIRNVTNRKWLTNGDTDTTGNTTGKNTMGAVFNLSMMANSSNQDGAAYIHNPYYVKKLLYDAIDWIDDGVLNYSTGKTLNALCSGGSAPPWCSGAMSYLLPNGVITGGIADERP